MSNIKPFTTSKGEFLAVEVPNDAFNFSIGHGNWSSTLYFDRNSSEIHNHIGLDKSKYSIMGLQSEIKEKKAKNIIMLWEQKEDDETIIFSSFSGALNSLIKSIECDKGNWLILSKKK